MIDTFYDLYSWTYIFLDTWKLLIEKFHFKCITCLEAHEGAIARCGSEEVDLLIEHLPEGDPPPISKEAATTLEDLEKMSRKDRLAFWQKEFQKCLRCYACRSACPLCYCEQCITEKRGSLLE